MLIKMLILLIFAGQAFAKEASLSFDDAPMGNTALYSGLERTSRILKTLEKHNTQAIFFSNTAKLSKSNGLERMKLYDDAGHIIGNHTHSHPHLNRVSPDLYIDEINKADKLLRQFKNFKKIFRYPYLAHGRNVEDRDNVRIHLKKLGYKNGYVTIDLQDWFMSSLLVENVKNGNTFSTERLCRAYTDMVLTSLEYFEKHGVKLLGRSPSHSILLHENDLAAHCLDPLITEIKKNGWKIVSPERTFADPVYSIQPNTLYNGSGQIAALYKIKFGVVIGDPWSTPWNDGARIRKELKSRNVFSEKSLIKGLNL